ncbi:hypothetical protein TNCV_668881 [Trichonephila clavipes]|nr:hypothetical protein TNCV_668881 [Trichonephila clavipes]
MGNTGLDILSKLVRLGQRKQVCLQWIPSYVGVPVNEATDELAGVLCGRHWLHCIHQRDCSVPATVHSTWYHNFAAHGLNVGGSSPIALVKYISETQRSVKHNTRTFGDRPRNSEPCSSDEDDTLVGTPSPTYHTTPMGGRLGSQ